jgi:hypothetical protein
MQYFYQIKALKARYGVFVAEKIFYIIVSEFFKPTPLILIYDELMLLW